MKIEQIRRKSAMPVANPSYPRGPYRFVDREYLIVAYEFRMSKRLWRI